MFSFGLRCITLFFLLGCATSATPPHSPQENPPQLFGNKNVLTAQIPPESGLIIEGRSLYNLENELQRFKSQPPVLQLYPVRYPIFTFFGTFDDRFVRSQTTDIHQFILPLLTRKIEQSPLKYEKWNSAYRLSFNIFSLRFDLLHAAEGDWQQTGCWTEIGVTLQHIPDGNIVFAQQPNFIIQVKKKTPGGKQTLDALYEKSAEQIFQVLADYWANKDKMKIEN